MLAMSCNLMKKVSTQQKIFDGECESLLSASIHEVDYPQNAIIKKSINDYIYDFLQMLSLKHVYLYQFLNKKHDLKKLAQQKITINHMKEIDIYKHLFTNTKWKENNSKNEIIITYKGKTVTLENTRLLKIGPHIQIQEINHYLGTEDDSSSDELSLLIKTKAASYI